MTDNFFPKKLDMDFAAIPPSMDPMVIDTDDRAELPRRLFALAARRLESAAAWAGRGEARGLDPGAISELAGNLHTCGQDLLVLADAIVAIACEDTGT